MTNVVLDTNIYGKIIEDPDSDRLIEKIICKDSFIIHDYRIIRDEIKRAPKPALKIYDKLVKTQLFADTNEISKLADEYFKEYKSISGVKNLSKIIKDFKIVAYASLKNCDIIFSNDEKTMKHNLSTQAYKVVNLRKNLRTPTFYTYQNLKRSFS